MMISDQYEAVWYYTVFKTIIKNKAHFLSPEAEIMRDGANHMAY